MDGGGNGNGRSGQETTTFKRGDNSAREENQNTVRHSRDVGNVTSGVGCSLGILVTIVLGTH